MVLLSACQKESGQTFSPGQAKTESSLSGSVLLGDALPYPGLQPHHFSDESEQAWRVPASNTGGWAIDPSNRQLARAFYNSVYLASNNTPIAWTGNHSTCTPGTTSSEFKDAVLARINYFRAMAGVPASITFNATFNTKAQQAALMMSANNSLSHNPPSSWNCYTADGATAAGSSNISWGHNAWNAVDGQIQDNGIDNHAVGHRRWLLHPQTQTMGTGDVPKVGSLAAANAIWVFDGNAYSTRPATRDDFIAWPTKGFNPYPVVPVRWSFSYPSANFTNATVSMTQGGTSIPVALETVANGYGENTLVWRPNNMTANQNWPKPTTDTSYQVTVSNVIVGGSPRSFTYTVTVFDPQTAGVGEEQVTVSGNTSPPANTPATYTFNPVAFAQQYEAYIAEIAAATGVYNAETGSLNVTDGTDSSYTLVYSGSGTNGTNVYRLAPATESETVEFPRIYIPSSNSVLQFDSKLGLATNEQTAAMQISLDGGASWQDIYSKTGTNSGSVEETAFSTKSISLSAYANKLVKFRAQYRHTGYRYLGTGTNVSFLVDNVQINNAQQVVAENTQNTGSNTSFNFTPVSGKRYALTARVIPWAGYPGLAWGSLLYSETSAAVDTQPNAFSFSAQTAVARSTVITSNAITVSGINTGAAISVSGGSYSINGGAFTNAAGLVNNGNTVRVQHTSSANYSSSTNTTLSIGGVTGTFTSTTAASTGTYALNVNKTGTGSGTITSSITGINCGTDCEEPVITGRVISLYAKPVTGSRFTGWTGAGATSCTTSTTCRVTMTEAKTLTAHFDLVLTAKTVGSGTITSTDGAINCGTACSQAYPNQATITLTATPASGYGLYSWAGCSAVTGNTCTVSAFSASKTVTATFRPLVPLTVGIVGTGKVTSSPVSLIDCGTDCSEAMVTGKIISLYAKPVTGSRFTGWTGAGATSCTTSTTCRVTMTEAKTLTANFTSP
ncbi:MAG: CAP domain-containing protein [Candidatus Thiothrix putei]|uniref:CAP domain-containing protein n=1 Tax=Candidatus Thiothrix putei TaxID=3080811 RepID=A0AA95HAY6_9GAMM|nr:MAG: CAP domain-containing protein [Candidatus Thiothrix putei]